MKRNLIIICIAVIVLAAGYFLLSNEKISFSKEVSYYKAIPIDAPIFFEINGLKNISLTSEIISGFYESEILTPFFTKISYFDTLITKSKEISEGLKNESFIIALNPEGKENTIPLIILKAESNKKKKTIENLLSAVFPKTSNKFIKRDYNGRKIFNTKGGKPFETFSYSFTNGLFIASSKSLTIEKTIRQLDSENVLNNITFAKVNKTATQQAEVSIYINHKHFPNLIRNWVNPTVQKMIDEFGIENKISFKKNTQKFINYAEWSELDLLTKDNELKLNGISIALDSLNQYLTIFSGQEPIRFQADKVLPRSTSMFMSINFSDKKKFFENLENFNRHNEVYYSRQEKIKKINSIARSDIKLIFEEIIDNEAAISFLDIPNDPTKKSTCFTISAKGKSQAKEKITNWLKQYSKRKKINYSELLMTYEIDKETKFELFKFPFPSFPGIWLGAPFTSVSAKYMAFWDNYVIFTNTQKSLENLLNNLTLEATLAKDVNYLQFKQNIENKTNINFYLNINKGFSLNKEFLTGEFISHFKAKEEQIRKFRSLNWQVLNSRDIYFNNIYLTYSENRKEDAKTTWQSNIGANTAFKPQLVINHSDKTNKEIITQDENQKLHLITKDGRVRWSLDFQEKILGKIHQIDYLRNRKLQFLFNTKTKIYLIDRNGNNVSPFPITLRSPATNGLSVFDYDNNRKYRYFVAGEDKKIYAYDGSGKIIPGWKFGKTDHLVTLPVQHFRVSGKDYIVFKDKSKIYIQDRKGQTRVNVLTKFENSRNPIILNTTGTTKMITTDIDGGVYYLYFNGKFLKKNAPKMSKNHFFNVNDINSNGLLDFVFIDNQKLIVIDENGKKLFTEKFKSAITNYPNIYTFSPKEKKIGVVNQSENRIYLFGPDGNLHQGFPLHGNSEFSIGKINSGSNYLNLIVGSNDENIYNYRL